MKNDNRDRVLIFFGDPDAPIRQVIRTTMASENYRNIEVFNKLQTLRDSIRNLDPHLIIIDSGLPEGDAIKLISDVRLGKVGRNPFVPIITTTWDPIEIRFVKSLIVVPMTLVKPLSPAQLMTRISVLADNRKPFVVTSDYIEPDRRDEAPESRYALF